MTAHDPVHVAVGLIKNQAGEILITRRADGAHQGGLWEFPGGKVEAGETVGQALARELEEELNIRIGRQGPAITVRYRYPDKSVLLDVRRIEQFSGNPQPCEGQPMKWVRPEELPHHAFPAANLPIITAARLPECYAILEGGDIETLRRNLRKILKKGTRLVQLRAKTLPVSERKVAIGIAVAMCREQGAELLLNSSLEDNGASAEAGLHLTSRELLKLRRRPHCPGWLAASCHSKSELRHAQKIGVDFAVLAPVRPTVTHPDAEPLGWSLFGRMVDDVNIPVYALGGMQWSDVQTAREAGGQGVAGIRLFTD
ncbi:MAG: Nudix family hydrolase [Gammaproteobacteria bacterium]